MSECAASLSPPESPLCLVHVSFLSECSCVVDWSLPSLGWTPDQVDGGPSCLVQMQTDLFLNQPEQTPLLCASRSDDRGEISGHVSSVEGTCVSHSK